MKKYDYNEKERKKIFQNMADNQMINNLNHIQNNFNIQNNENNHYYKSPNQNRYEENNNFNIQKNINKNYHFEGEFDFDNELYTFNKFGNYLEKTGYMKKILLFLITIFHISKVEFFSNYKVYILSFLIIEILIFFHYKLFSSKRINLIKNSNLNFNKYHKNIKKIKTEVDYYIDNNGNIGIGYDIFQIGYSLISDLCLIIILNIIGLLSN